jgi:hypothetical protein
MIAYVKQSEGKIGNIKAEKNRVVIELGFQVWPVLGLSGFYNHKLRLSKSLPGLYSVCSDSKGEMNFSTVNG